MDRPSADGGQESVIFEGWLMVWEDQKDSMKSVHDGKGPYPVWEPHLCVINMSTRRLSHFRTDKAAHDARQNMLPKVELIGTKKEEFDSFYGIKSTNKNDVLLNSPLATIEAAIEKNEKSRTLDSRSNNSGGTSNFDNCALSPPEGRRGSTSSLTSQEAVKPVSSQSKFANFFTRKSQQWKSNIGRAKSVNKLDKKKIGNGTNGDSDNDNKLPPPFSRSLSLGRISRKWLARPQVGLRGSDAKLREESREKIRNQRMGKSQSLESLLTATSSLHCIDLSIEGVDVQPLHLSILGLENCFVVVAGGNRGCKYYRCITSEERLNWIRHLRQIIQLDHSYRKENSLEIVVAEAKYLPAKRSGVTGTSICYKRYFCEICVDQTVYARTSSKLMNEMLFWAEHFEFSHLPSVTTITLNLYRENEKKKKKDRYTLLAYVNINMSEINSQQMLERWYFSSSAVVGKSGKDNRSECAQVRIKARYQSISILPITYYQPLINYLKSEYRQVVDTLEPVVDVKSKEEIAVSMVTLSHSLDCVASFISDIVITEFNRSDNVTLALRGNSIATKAIEAYMRLVGQKYLIKTLGDVVKSLFDQNFDCEVDPAKVSPPTALKTNQETLVKQCGTFWYKIYNSLPAFPLELRQVFAAIRTHCNGSDFKGEVCDQLVSSCVFLRFFCPAILNPNLFSLTHEYPDEKTARNLTLIAKTIQGLANLTKFGGKEEFMTFLNDFVMRELDEMRKFLHYISEVESDHTLAKEFEGDVDLGKELAVLHRLLTVSLQNLNEASKEKLGSLPNILRDLTHAQNLPEPRLVKKSRLYASLGNTTPSAADRIASLMTPTTRKSFDPPATPTTIVSPLTPETISPETHFEVQNPVELSFVSTTSLSISATPTSQKNHIFCVSTLPCSPSARRISAPRSRSHYQSIDDLLKTHHLEMTTPLRDENLSPSVSSLSSKRPDEKQLTKDWEKMKDAAATFSNNKCLKLVAFNESGMGGEGSLDRKVGSRVDRSTHRKGSDVLPLPQSFFMPEFSRPLPTLKPVSFCNPMYQSNNMRDVGGAGEGTMGSTSSLGSEGSLGRKPRRATPPGFKDGTTRLKTLVDVCRDNQCFRSGSSDTLNGGRLSVQTCPQSPDACLKLTIPITPAAGSTEKRSSFCTTVSVPLSKSLDFPASLSNSPLLSVRRVATESHIMDSRRDSAGSGQQSSRPEYHYTLMTLPPAGTRSLLQCMGNTDLQSPMNFEGYDLQPQRSESQGYGNNSAMVYSSTLPQPMSKLRSMPKKRTQNCNSAEFSQQIESIERKVAETQRMVVAELQLLDEGSASSLSSGRPPMPPALSMADQSDCDSSPRPTSVKKKGLRAKSSKKTEPPSLISSMPAAETESLSSSANEEGVIFTCGDEETLETDTLPSYVDLNSETVFTINLGDHGQPFKTTYC